jgi:ribonuclease J
LMVVVSVDAASGKVVAGPDVVSRGFSHPRQSGDLIETARERLRESLNGVADESGNGSVSSRDVTYIQRKIKDTVGEYLYQQTRRRPMILPVVMEV